MDKTSDQRLRSAAIIVMISTVLSRVSGYLRETLILSKIGANWVGDAYNTAFLLPDLMFQLLLGGALASALIPVLSQYIVKRDLKEGWKAIGTFINISVLGTVCFCIIGTMFAPKIIPIIATGFLEKELKIQILTISLTRILLPSTAFLLLAAFCNGILNSYNKFATASLGPIIYNIGGIISIAIFGSNSPENVKMIAFGIMLSSIIYFIYNILSTFKLMSNYQFKLHLKHPGFIKLFKLAIPSIIASSIFQINFIISNKYATFSSSGNLTLFNTANKTWQLPLGIFAQSIGIALLPTMSSLVASKQISKFKELIIKGVKSILLFSIPSAIAFIVLNQQIIRTLFKFSNKFTEQNVETTGRILVFFSLALVAQSAQAIFVRAFFSLNDTKTPLFIGATTIVLNFILTKVLYGYMGINGLALATSLSSATNVLLLLAFLNRKISGLDIIEMIKFITTVLLVSIVMGSALYYLNSNIYIDLNNKINQVLWIVIEIGFGIVIFSILSIFLKVDILYPALKSILNKLIDKFYKI